MAVTIAKVIGEGDLSSRIDYVHLSRKGLSMKAFNRILDFTSLTNKEISQILPVSERQMSRYDDDHVLRKDISSHLIQLVELFEKGFEVFGSVKFKIWIRSKSRVLGQSKPIELLDTPIGMEMVRDILGRIEYGVYT